MCGEVAVKKYMLMENDENVKAKDKIDFIDNALKRWGTWEGTNYLRNQRSELTAPMFNAIMYSV